MVLSQAGYSYTTVSPDIDEKAVKGRTLDPSESALAVAYAKADHLSSQLSNKAPVLLICSDQIVSFNGQVREKPSTKEQVQP